MGDRGDLGARHTVAAAVLPRAQPWAALAVAAFGLNWAWEMLQAPLYESMRSLSFREGTWLCTVASGADVVLTLVAYAAVGALVGSRAWLLHPYPARLAGFLAVGLIITAILEILSVHYWGRWSYGPSMVRVLGVGLAPLAQWVVVPLVTLWVVRRHLGRVTMRSTSPDVPSDTRSNTLGDLR